MSYPIINITRQYLRTLALKHPEDTFYIREVYEGGYSYVNHRENTYKVALFLPENHSVKPKGDQLAWRCKLYDDNKVNSVDRLQEFLHEEFKDVVRECWMPEVIKHDLYALLD